AALVATVRIGGKGDIQPLAHRKSEIGKNSAGLPLYRWRKLQRTLSHSICTGTYFDIFRGARIYSGVWFFLVMRLIFGTCSQAGRSQCQPIKLSFRTPEIIGISRLRHGRAGQEQYQDAKQPFERAAFEHG